jgi:REP element-mobilizing transposase RayT
MSPDLARRIAARPGRHNLADRLLDRSLGRCWLRDVRIAGLVDGAIRFFDLERYLLHAWTIMPNHVHVAFRLLPEVQLEEVMKSWKGFTGREANEILGQKGTFWQAESYDSLLHDQHELDRVIEYIVRNPVRARLTNWPWTTVLRTQFSLGAGQV